MNSTIARNGPEQCDLVRYVSVANQYEVGRCDVTLDSARAHDRPTSASSATWCNWVNEFRSVQLSLIRAL